MTLPEHLKIIMQAAIDGKPVLAPDGRICVIVKIAHGRAKIRAQKNAFTYSQAWVPVELLRPITE